MTIALDEASRTAGAALQRPHVLIIGGGFTGLAAACTLTGTPGKRGGAGLPPRVTLLEKAPQLGGLAAGFQEEGWSSSLEHFYHHWFTSDSWVRHFATRWAQTQPSEGGTPSPELLFRRVSTVLEAPVASGARGPAEGQAPAPFWVLDSAASLLRFKPLPLADRLRMAAALAFLKLIRNGTKLERHTAAAWCRQWMGQRAYETVWQGLLEGKFGDDAESVNMAWLWARIRSRTPALGTCAGGFQRLVSHAATSLIGRGVEIFTQCGELSIERATGQRGYRVGTGSGQMFHCDALLFATSPHELLKHFEPDPSYSARVRSLRSLGALVCILSLHRPLKGKNAGHYWYSLRKSADCPFLAVVHHTALVPPEAFDGEHLYYVADYLPAETPRFRATDEEILSQALQALRKIEPELNDTVVKRNWVFRAPYAQPVTNVDASANLLPLHVTGLDGVFLASMAQVYPWDRGTNYALELGARVASAIHKHLEDAPVKEKAS